MDFRGPLVDHVTTIVKGPSVLQFLKVDPTTWPLLSNTFYIFLGRQNQQNWLDKTDLATTGSPSEDESSDGTFVTFCSMDILLLQNWSSCFFRSFQNGWHGEDWLLHVLDWRFTEQRSRSYCGQTDVWINKGLLV